MVDKDGENGIRSSSTNQLNKEPPSMADDQLSRVFAALADPTRRDMVARLAVGDATVGQLADPYDVSIQAVSKHIKVLADAGLVSRSKDAQRRPCHLEAEVFDLMTKWIERYRQQAQERYERLDAVLAVLRDGEQTNHHPQPQHPQPQHPQPQHPQSQQGAAS
jgi:DNA-binding transcriptional ArsR family regulator